MGLYVYSDARWVEGEGRCGTIGPRTEKTKRGFLDVVHERSS